MIITARWVVPGEREPISDGAVVTEGNTITGCGPSDELQREYSDHTVREFPQSVVMPGFVNAHTHLELSLLKGQLDSLPYMEWVFQGIPQATATWTRQDFMRSSEVGARDMIRSGITTVGDVTLSGASIPVLGRVGLRSVIFCETHGFSTSEKNVRSFSTMVSLYKQACSDLMRIGVSTGSLLTTGEDLLQALHSLAVELNCTFSVHVAESEEEVLAFTQGEGKAVHHLTKHSKGKWKVPHKTPVEYLDELALLDPHFLAVHCVHVTAEDIERMKKHGVAVVHCPTSNARLGCGIAPLFSMAKSGIPVGIGTDSAASNAAVNMFEESRWALLLQKASVPSAELTAEVVLQMATLGSAKALGIAGEVGSLEEGKKADLIVVDVPHFVDSAETLIPYLVFGCHQHDVSMSMIDGKIIYERNSTPCGELQKKK